MITTLAWWGHAHMVISRIADRMLSDKNHEILDKAINYGAMPQATVTDCATWQDDVKSPTRFYPMGNWHFADTPFDAPDFTGSHNPTTYNVTSYLHDAWETLNDETTTDPWVWAFHLRSIIHFVGDIHTPHHNVARYSKNTPSGDQGGNLYLLNCNYGSLCVNIHFFWDSCANKFSIMYPTIPKLWDTFDKNVTEIIDNYKPASTYDLNSYDPDEWHKESYQAAVEFGYSTPENGFPNSTYFEKAQEIGSMRISLAGRRLGNVLNHLLSLPNLPSYPTSSHAGEIIAWVLDGILLVCCIVIVILQFIAHRKRYSNIE